MFEKMRDTELIICTEVYLQESCANQMHILASAHFNLTPLKMFISFLINTYICLY